MAAPAATLAARTRAPSRSHLREPAAVPDHDVEHVDRERQLATLRDIHASARPLADGLRILEEAAWYRLVRDVDAAHAEGLMTEHDANIARTVTGTLNRMEMSPDNNVRVAYLYAAGIADRAKEAIRRLNGEATP